ncbi:MAG: CPBP family glutamic-type intramembrane protease [Gammaproteobacteria bacterium]|nr:CPBP family glutamic-type intramembrane protease [Gammaproteobacteria bacterium]
MQIGVTLKAAGIVAASLFFFVSAVLSVVLISGFNARVSPAIPWFVVFLLPALFTLTFWFDKRWNIGLRTPLRASGWKLAGFAAASMVASHSVLILEGAWHGMTRTFEMAPEGVTPLFAMVYWIGVVILMSTASEVSFRGLMQSGLQRVITGVWPVILIVSLANTLAHRWDGLLERTIGVFAILVAWGYLRHLSGSLAVTIATHIIAIIVWDAILWFRGPWDQSAMSMNDLLLVTFVGLMAFVISLWFARIIRAEIGSN